MVPFGFILGLYVASDHFGKSATSDLVGHHEAVLDEVLAEVLIAVIEDGDVGEGAILVFSVEFHFAI